ncbi:unnamed protein product [Acanthosepion pharaonis]|uniref:Uncharacterized protein n=1 Tax=Acanthosepion pharaonis TaxID=158019 RepID=A0A812EM58_ACAPH|nr:unnamed protein product [Sepia pharaonis]
MHHTAVKRIFLALPISSNAITSYASLTYAEMLPIRPTDLNTINTLPVEPSTLLNLSNRRIAPSQLARSSLVAPLRSTCFSTPSTADITSDIFTFFLPSTVAHYRGLQHLLIHAAWIANFAIYYSSTKEKSPQTPLTPRTPLIDRISHTISTVGINYRVHMVSLQIILLSAQRSATPFPKQLLREAERNLCESFPGLGCLLSAFDKTFCFTYLTNSLPYAFQVWLDFFFPLLISTHCSSKHSQHFPQCLDCSPTDIPRL